MLINLLIKDIKKVVIRGKVFIYLCNCWKVLKNNSLEGISAANRRLLVELRVGVYNR